MKPMVRKYQKFQNFSQRQNLQDFHEVDQGQLQLQRTAQGD